MLSSFLAELISKIVEPIIKRITDGVIAQFEAYQKAKEIGRIGDAEKSSENAKTSEDVEKAAVDAAKATSHL